MADLPPAETEDDLPEPPRLRALRRMVSLLTATLIVGVIIVVGALVIRLSRPSPPPFDARAVAAERVALPEGEAVLSAGAAGGALILITRDGAGAERMRLFDAATGAELRAVRIERR